MKNEKTLADKILQYNDNLSKISVKVPDGYKTKNPYNGETRNKIKEIATLFYKKYYNDTRKRRLILGSSPARRGTAVTGIPFEDAAHLQKETGIYIDEFYVNKSSSGFLYDVIEKYGGCDKFYDDFYMNFLCPIGIVKINPKGKEVNCNYYDNQKLQKALEPLIIQSLLSLVDLGIDSTICYCIGSGKNYEYLSKINQKYKIFNEIIPLEHPRFIMQYNTQNKEKYLEKYLNALNKKLMQKQLKQL